MSHRHSFTMLPAVLGPYGRQDVHYHPCHGNCAWALVDDGRRCNGQRETHREEKLPLAARVLPRRRKTFATISVEERRKVLLKHNRLAWVAVAASEEGFRRRARFNRALLRLADYIVGEPS